MEHRWSVRRRVDGRARLSCPNGAAAQAVIRDLSLGGIGLVTHCVLTPGICLRVAFVLDDDPEHTGHVLPGMVVHGNDDRAGLVFLDAAPQALRALRLALQQREPAALPGAPRARRVA